MWTNLSICLDILWSIKYGSCLSPVTITTRSLSLFFLVSSINFKLAILSSGIFKYPILIARLTIFCVFLPRIATLLPKEIEISTIIWIRWRSFENSETIILPSAETNIFSIRCLNSKIVPRPPSFKAPSVSGSKASTPSLEAFTKDSYIDVKSVWWAFWSNVKLPV